MPSFWKESRPRDQSIRGLYCRSQRYPRTAAHEGSRVVTMKSMSMAGPDGNRTEIVTKSVSISRSEPSKRRSCKCCANGLRGRRNLEAKDLSIKQSVEPESTSVLKVGTESAEREITRESILVSAAAFSCATGTEGSSEQWVLRALDSLLKSFPTPR